MRSGNAKIRELTSICRPKQWKTISQHELTSGGYPVYGANGKIGFYGEYNHEDPTVLITCRGATCGTINISEPRSYVTGNAMALDQLSPEVDFRFLAYALRFRGFQDVISGSAQPQITREGLTKVTVTIPPLQDQLQVVDLLTRAESIVRMRQVAEQKAKEIIPALFLDMFGHPARNPRGWRTTDLGNVVSGGPQNGLYKHADTYGSGTPILRIDGFYDGRVRPIAEWRRLRLEAAEFERFRLAEGDIVVNRVNSPEHLGKSALIPQLLEPAVYESNMMRLSVRRETVLPEFIIAFLQTGFARGALIKNAKHAINQSSINQADVKSVPIYLPPMSDQEIFSSRAGEGRTLQDQQRRATAQATNTFQSLLAEAFGEKGI
jgi:type I restriction enzyme S subunit